jgi:hypothetical protein
MVIKKRKSARLAREAGTGKKIADNRLERKLAVARTVAGTYSYSKI